MDTSTRSCMGTDATAQDGAPRREAGATNGPGYANCCDETLVLRTRAGEFTAFDELIRRHQGGLYAMALGALPDAKAAGDALCEMAVAAFRDVRSVKARRSPAGWLRLHGFRVLFPRMKRHPRGHAVVNWPAPVATSDLLD